MEEQPAIAQGYRNRHRVVDLHPVTLAQNARTSGGGNITMVPQKAITVGPQETWQRRRFPFGTPFSDNPLGQRLTTLMIAEHRRQRRA